MKKSEARALNLDSIYLTKNSWDTELEFSEANADSSGNPYVIFKGLGIESQLRGVSRWESRDKEIEYNVRELKNEFSNIKLSNLEDSYSINCSSIGAIAELDLGSDIQRINISVESVAGILAESTITKGKVKDTCMFLPSGIGRATLVVRDGPTHKEYLQELEIAKGLKKTSVSKFNPGDIFMDGNLLIDVFYLPTIKWTGTKFTLTSKYRGEFVTPSSGRVYDSSTTETYIKELKEYYEDPDKSTLKHRSVFWKSNSSHIKHVEDAQIVHSSIPDFKGNKYDLVGQSRHFNRFYVNKGSNSIDSVNFQFKSPKEGKEFVKVLNDYYQDNLKSIPQGGMGMEGVIKKYVTEYLVKKAYFSSYEDAIAKYPVLGLVPTPSRWDTVSFPAIEEVQPK